MLEFCPCGFSAASQAVVHPELSIRRVEDAQHTSLSSVEPLWRWKQSWEPGCQCSPKGPAGLCPAFLWFDSFLFCRVGEGRACWSLGNAYVSLGSHEQALHFARKHLEISQEVREAGANQREPMTPGESKPILFQSVLLMQSPCPQCSGKPFSLCCFSGVLRNCRAWLENTLDGRLPVFPLITANV